MHRAAVLAGAAVIAVALSGCAGGRSGAGASPTVAVSSPAPLTTGSSDVPVIGALPDRRSILLRGAAPLPSLSPAWLEDLGTLARSKHITLEAAVRDYGYQESFDSVAEFAQSIRGYSDAVFRPGVHEASELRFRARPSQEALDALRARYPRLLRIEWGERLGSDVDRDHLSVTVSNAVGAVPGTRNVTTGIDGDGRLAVDYDGTASAREVADAILRDGAFRATFVDGVPPTEVRITRVADFEISAL